MHTLTEEKPTGERKVLSISELNRKAKELLEIHLPLVWVEGEISNLSQPSSGHWYFTLKDQNAQVRCAMFRGRNQLLKFKLAAGDNVVVRTRVSLYEGRGEFQLIVEHMEQAGFGLLQKRFEELKNKLQDEGLFDDIHKKELPEYVSRIAVITSATGAAIRDVLHVLERRFPLIEVNIIPTLVQGEDAAAQIIDAIKLANKLVGLDLILLCRGGGSIEDLWAFNSEKLARAIFASKLPVISAVGHEVDFTISDFVADLRAPTPSVGAEMISPDATELLDTFDGYALLCENAVTRNLEKLKDRVKHLAARVRHPSERLQNRGQQLDQLEIRLRISRNNFIDANRARLSNAMSLLGSPRPLIQKKRAELAYNKTKLYSLIQHYLGNKKLSLQKFCGMLDVVSPLGTLQRGYAIALKKDGSVVRSSTQVTKGESLDIRLHEGKLSTKIE